jgi:hypothetical protein
MAETERLHVKLGISDYFNEYFSYTVHTRLFGMLQSSGTVFLSCRNVHSTLEYSLNPPHYPHYSMTNHTLSPRANVYRS